MRPPRGKPLYCPTVDELVDHLWGVSTDTSGDFHPYERSQARRLLAQGMGYISNVQLTVRGQLSREEIGQLLEARGARPLPAVDVPALPPAPEKKPS